VAERYEVTRPLGEGGFGKAFVVLDKQDFRQYVLKRMDCGSEEEAANAVKEVHAHHTFIDITSYIHTDREIDR
jgi:serine/threonine protein kinase